MWRKGNPSALLVGIQIDTVTVENGIELTQKIKKIKLLYDPVFILLGIHPKKPETHSEESMHPYIHCNVIYNSQDSETAQLLISRRVDKKWWYIHTVEYYSAIKRRKSYL